MRDLSNEDQERIEKAAKTHFDRINKADDGNETRAYILGAKYEHPIARKEGFNEAIEEVKGKLNELFGYKIGEYQYATVNKNTFFEEIEKLKR